MSVFKLPTEVLERIFSHSLPAWRICASGDVAPSAEQQLNLTTGEGISGIGLDYVRARARLSLALVSKSLHSAVKNSRSATWPSNGASAERTEELIASGTLRVDSITSLALELTAQTYLMGDATWPGLHSLFATAARFTQLLDLTLVFPAGAWGAGAQGTDVEAFEESCASVLQHTAGLPILPRLWQLCFAQRADGTPTQLLALPYPPDDTKHTGLQVAAVENIALRCFALRRLEIRCLLDIERNDAFQPATAVMAVPTAQIWPLSKPRYISLSMHYESLGVYRSIVRRLLMPYAHVFRQCLTMEVNQGLDWVLDKGNRRICCRELRVSYFSLSTYSDVLPTVDSSPISIRARATRGSSPPFDMSTHLRQLQRLRELHLGKVESNVEVDSLVDLIAKLPASVELLTMENLSSWRNKEAQEAVERVCDARNIRLEGSTVKT